MLLTVWRGKKWSRWHGDTKDCSLLLLELVKMEAHGCQLGWTSNKSHKECNSLKRGQELDVKLSKVQRTLSLHSWQLYSVLGTGPDRKLVSENCGQIVCLMEGLQRWRPLQKPLLQNNDKLPTDGVSHGSGVGVKHLQAPGRGPALLS